MENSAENMIQNILGNPQAMEKIMGMVQSLQTKEPVQNEDAKLPFDFSNPETLSKISKMMQLMNSDDDPRINLLSAIKPFLSPRRIKGADQAMQLLKLSKISGLFEEFNIL